MHAIISCRVRVRTEKAGAGVHVPDAWFRLKSAPNMPTPYPLEPDSQVLPLAPPTVEEGMEPEPAATQDCLFLLGKRAKELGAVDMLPGPADDHLLTPDEIEPRAAELVIYEGFNYSQASRRYLKEINPDDPSVAVEHGCGESRLRKLYRDERQAPMAVKTSRFFWCTTKGLCPV